jgi:hypothetical protein
MTQLVHLDTDAVAIVMTKDAQPRVWDSIGLLGTNVAGQ